MKIPRDIKGIELAKCLTKYQYQITRQTGSHIRVTTYLYGEHKVTIPAHNPVRVGTLSSILKDVANYLKIPKDELIKELFEK